MHTRTISCCALAFATSACAMGIEPLDPEARGSRTTRATSEQLTCSLSDPSCGGDIGTSPGLEPGVDVAPTLPAIVRIEGNTAEWRDLLIRALEEPLCPRENPPLPCEQVPLADRPGRTVLLAHNVDIDLTGYENLHISQGVTLTSEVPAAGNAPVGGVSSAHLVVPIPEQRTVARDSQRLGPRLYTTSRPVPLFHIECNGSNIFGDRVRLSGFRLQGPHWGTVDGADNLEEGIRITSCKGVEISNMEISGWSGIAVHVLDPLNRQSRFSNDVKIHDNFVHHNQHRGRNGYGIAVKDKAYASIERNVFDFNRHAIEAGGEAGNEYSARHNLVLKGGGHHDTFWLEWTHQFDVHGDQNCYDIPAHDDSDWGCGNAGTYFEYIGNTFQYTNDNAIKVRGTPREYALVYNNVFAHDDIDDAVVPNDNHHVEVHSNNITDSDQYGNYGVCDFDGDRRDDLFMATGVTWWFLSGGKREWRYLATRREKLNEVGLGDFDGDGRCDVFSVQGNTWGISKRGTGAFSPLLGNPYGVPFNELAFGDFNGDGRKDIFRRASSGQWSVISPGVYPWTLLQSSSRLLSELRFADFDGNGITDVARVANTGWYVSWEGRSTWTLLSPPIPNPASVFIGDVDGVPGDDLVSLVRRSDMLGATWHVSSGGSRPFQPLTSVGYLGVPPELRPAASLRTIMGRFDTWNGGDMLVLTYTRTSRLFSEGHSNLTPYGLYAY